MTSLYNCKHDGDIYRITKFNSDFNVESSYLCDLNSCECPAGVRPSCRHRQMLPKFIHRNHIGDEWFYDHDRGGWVQGSHIEEPTSLDPQEPYGIGPMMHHLPQINAENKEDRKELAAREASLAPAGLGWASGARPSTIDEDDIEIFEPSARMGDGSPVMAGVNAKVVSSPPPSPTIRRRV